MKEEETVWRKKGRKDYMKEGNEGKKDYMKDEERKRRNGHMKGRKDYMKGDRTV